VDNYNNKLAKAKNVEVIHMNLDQDEASMTAYAKSFNFPFPVVPGDKGEKMKILSKLAPSGVPGYKLVDSAGSVVAEGHAAWDKAAELAKVAE
jgi:hypothetical protein